MRNYAEWNMLVVSQPKRDANEMDVDILEDISLALSMGESGISREACLRVSQISESVSKSGYK